MNFAQKMDSVWNGLDEEERDGWLQDARDLAQQENAELRKLGYDADSVEWIGPEGVLENAKELAYEVSPQGLAEAEARRRAVKENREARRRNDLARVREASDRGMAGVYVSGDWVEVPIQQAGVLHDRILAEVEEARVLGL